MTVNDINEALEDAAIEAALKEMLRDAAEAAGFTVNSIGPVRLLSKESVPAPE